jgi:phage terminase large subunit GpA-like protein
LFLIPDSADLVEAAEATVMECPHCTHHIWHDGMHGEPGKHELNQTVLGNAKWVKEGQLWLPRSGDDAAVQGRLEGRGVRSDLAAFWLKGPAANFATWRDVVLKYLQAQEVFQRTGAQEALKTTINTDQGLPFLPAGMEHGRLAEDVRGMAEDVGEGTVPAHVRFLVATIDVQKSRFEVQVHGLGYGGDVTVIDRFAIRKSRRLDEDGEREPLRPASYVEDWDLLIDQVMLKTYPLADGSGREMRMRMVGCDSGGSASKKNDSSTTKTAYAFYRRLKQADGAEIPAGLHRRFLLLKGGSTATAPRVKISYPDSERRDRHAGARGDVPVLMLNTTALKDQLDAMLDRERTGGGRVRFADWLPDEFWDEMVAEARGPKGWEKLSARNEAWDLLVYCLAVALYRPIRVETLDWDEPPGWADQWDDNSMVFNPAKGEKAEETVAPRTSLKDLAAALA